MIVDPSAPVVTPPHIVTSPEGWLRAAVDPAWAGVSLAVDFTAGSTPLDGASDVLHVRIVRQDPGAPAPVPVRSADTAWAVGGAGPAYDHEAPLGVGVAYTATPLYADGTEGQSTSLAVSVPAPAPGPGDVWIKSLDTPGASLRVTVTDWPALNWTARTDTADVAGSPYPAASQDVYSSASSSITLDAGGPAITTLLDLIRRGEVLLLQTRPDYYRPDQYVMLGDISQTTDAAPDGSRTYTVVVTEVDRPDTAGQPLRLPGWSWDTLAASFDSWETVASSYGSWTSLALDGAL
ncbi:hypothetical protein [Streptomyces hirsutus]|uniref:hypothetical protein n=1 Tax=Streptomyces hirsutus TaxID=35620 RepID=UPI00366471DE